MIRNKQPKNDSLFEGLSIIETIVVIMLPIVLTWLDYIILKDMFDFNWWVTLIIASLSTIGLIWLLTISVGWLMERD